MSAAIERELEAIRATLIAESRADVAGALDMLDAAREAIELARTALDGAEALARFLAPDVDEQFEGCLDLGTNQLSAALLAIRELARV